MTQIAVDRDTSDEAFEVFWRKLGGEIRRARRQGLEVIIDEDPLFHGTGIAFSWQGTLYTIMIKGLVPDPPQETEARKKRTP